MPVQKSFHEFLIPSFSIAAIENEIGAQRLSGQHQTVSLELVFSSSNTEASTPHSAFPEILKGTKVLPVLYLNPFFANVSRAASLS